MKIQRCRLLPAAAAVLAAVGVSVLSGCSAEAEGTQVLTSFYPLQFVAERVGGDLVAVDNLTPAGAEPHDLELSPRDVATLEASDVMVFLAGFQPSIDDAVAQVNGPIALDVTGAARLAEPEAQGEEAHGDDTEASVGTEPAQEDHEHGTDPHFWLDPTRLADVADATAEALSEADPDNAEQFAANAATLRTELETLDQEFTDGLAECGQDMFVVSHEAFGYLAVRYGLHQVGISGLDPEAEPSPARLAEISEIVEREGVTTIFTESLVSPEVAEVLADELGVEVATLDPIEGLSEGTDDYLDAMRHNLAALREALVCT